MGSLFKTPAGASSGPIQVCPEFGGRLGGYRLLERLPGYEAGSVPQDLQPVFPIRQDNLDELIRPPFRRYRTDNSLHLMVLDTGFVEEWRQRVRRLVQLLPQLNHSTVQQIKDIGDDQYCLYVVTPFVAKDTLRTAGVRGGDFKRLMISLMQGVEYLHKQGYIHSNLTPDEVLAPPSGSARFLDLSLIIPIEKARQIANLGRARGVPAYIAPESWEGACPDEKTDQYALGIMIYEGLLGQRPFIGPDLETVRDRHLREQPPSVRNAKMDEVLQTMTAKNPTSRYQTMTHALKALTSAWP